MQQPVVNFTQHLKAHSFVFVISACLFSFFTFLSPLTAAAIDEPAYEEITVYMNSPGLGGTDLDVVIKGKEAYLSITELFEFLKIKNKISANQDSISGFFITQNNNYLINKINNSITLEQKIYTLSADDLIKTPSGLYLKSGIFGKVFGLNCDFNFRSLSINLTTKLDLPVLHEKRQEMMRQNLGKLKSEIVADTTIRRKYQAFNLGTADWAVSSTQQQGGSTSTLMNLRLGAIVSGGETTINLSHNTQGNFELKQQNYLWRYVKNDNPLVRQVLAGTIPVQTVSTLSAPVVGLQVTNAPTTIRRSMGTYTLSEHTNPEWTVELYMNNVLIDYVKADASGFFSFQVPMVYGSSVLQLRFFGPWGEEQTKEENISVPYNFLPKNELQYTASSGIVENGQQGRLVRFEANYGLSRLVTIGSGTEYLSSVSLNPVMPFANIAYRPVSTLVFSGDYTLNVRTRAIATYQMKSELTFELDYTKYKEGQEAILNSFVEERKAVISKQFRGMNFSGFARFSLDEVVYPNTKQTLSDLMFSYTWKNVSSNITTYTVLMDKDFLNTYSNLAVAWALPHRYTLRPQLQYTYTSGRLNSATMEIEKQLFGSGFVNLTVNNNLVYHTMNATLGLRFDLSFARAAFSATQANKRTSLTQSFSGGAVYDQKTKYAKLNNRSNVGRAGMVIYAFLDLNGNNRRDENEPKIPGLQIRVSGGRMQPNLKDSTIQVFDLEPYTSYLVELNRDSFDNIAWQFKNATYKVAIDPNQLKLIEVPVQVSGEVSGNVYASKADSTGQGRITVNFYRNGSVLVGHALTENDGYFNFLGLPPGSYTACLDEAQLKRLHLTASCIKKPFKIKASVEGDVVPNVNFKLIDTEKVKP